MRELYNKIREVDLEYEANEVLNFASDLGYDYFNLFLTYRYINRELPYSDRDTTAAMTLDIILNYIHNEEAKSIEAGNKAKVRIAKSIDEFMYMIRNKLDYVKLIEEKKHRTYWIN